MDDGRVWDIAATVRYLDEKAGGKVKWKVIGRLEQGKGWTLTEAAIRPVLDELIRHRDNDEREQRPDRGR